MNGKAKCKILKEIRRRIAEENDISYAVRECTHQGNCKGTCPRCEAEVRYLEQELEKRRKLGKKVTLAAIAAGLSIGLMGCTLPGGGTNAGSEVTIPSGKSGAAGNQLKHEKDEDLDGTKSGMNSMNRNDDDEDLAGAIPDIDVTEGEPSVDPNGDEYELEGDPVEYVLEGDVVAIEEGALADPSCESNE